MHEGFYLKYGKRSFDLAAVTLALPIALPCAAAVSVLVWLFLGRPILFRQLRSGRCGTVFTLLKFRTMRDIRNEAGELLPDSERLTAFGRFLRSTSLDELPAIWNVLRGEMSLIGPRPLPAGYSRFYDAEQARRLTIRPGMAGYAALFGRNAQPWESIFARDVWYVDHVGFLLDLRIVVGIFGVVLSRKGIDRGMYIHGSEFQRRLDGARTGESNASGS